jgi:hypothetical protein
MKNSELRNEPGIGTRPGSRNDLIILAALIVLGVFAYLPAHQRTLDPIIDAGRDLYLAERLAHGEVLYRDYVYNYPPVAPYLLALVVRIFGASLAVFTVFGIATALVTLVTLYITANLIAGRVAAGAIGALFVTLNFTGASTWGANYIFPYAYAATVGMMFLLLALLFVLRGWEWTAVSMAILAAGCKIEYAAAAIVLFVAAAGVKKVKTWTALFAAITSLIIAVASALASSVEGRAARQFYAQVSGLDTPFRSIMITALSAAGIVLFVFLLRQVHARKWLVLLSLALAIVTWLLASDVFFRAWALLQLAALVWAIARRDADLVILSTVAVVATARIALNLAPSWYGFVLVLPTYLVIARVLFNDLPALRVYSPRAAWLWLPLFGLIATAGLIQQRTRYEVKEYPIDTPRGRLYDANPDRARVLNEFIRTTRARSMVVFPEGVSLNYFTGIRNPLRRYIFTPPETAAPPVEAELLDALIEREPETVVILSRDVTEFGMRGFGEDYNRELASMIATRYRLERDWRLPRFRLALSRLTSSS